MLTAVILGELRGNRSRIDKAIEEMLSLELTGHDDTWTAPAQLWHSKSMLLKPL